MLKKLLIHTRKSMKLIILIAIALLLIFGVISSFYKVSYSVNINGVFVCFCFVYFLFFGVLFFFFGHAKDISSRVTYFGIFIYGFSFLWGLEKFLVKVNCPILPGTFFLVSVLKPWHPQEAFRL